MSIAWTAHGSASAACRATRVIGDGDERSMTACRWFDRHHDDRRMGDQAEGFPPRLLVEVSGRRRRIIPIIDTVQMSDDRLQAPVVLRAHFDVQVAEDRKSTRLNSSH